MKNTVLKLALLVLSLPLITACDPHSEEVIRDVNAMNEPLVKFGHFRSGSANFEIVIEKLSSTYRLSLLEDGTLNYPANTVFYDITSTHPSYGTLSSLFAGTTTLQRYVDPCPTCPKGFWSGFFATLKKDGSEVQVTLDGPTQMKIDELIDSVYLFFAPPVGVYDLINRYCLSGAQVNDAFILGTDSLELDFWSSTHFDSHETIGGVSTSSGHTWAIAGTTMLIDGGASSVGVYVEPGIYPSKRLTLTSPAFVGSGGSCPAGDHLITVLE